MELNFPRPLVAVGGCLALARQYPKSKAGHPSFLRHPSVKIDGKYVLARRLSYSLNVSEIELNPGWPCRSVMVSKCGNPWCLNPEHLELVTQGAALKGIKRSEETKKKMSKAGKLRWKKEKKNAS